MADVEGKEPEVERDEEESPAPAPEEEEEEAAVEEEAPEENENTPTPAAAPAPKEKKKREIAIPKDSAGWFRARARNLKMFPYTADGDLQVPELRGQPAKVIELPWYRPATIDEKAEEEEKLKEELAGVEREFDELLSQLKDALLNWKATGATAEVLRITQDLTKLDTQRSMIRSPLRWAVPVSGLETRDVLVNKFYEVKKVGETVMMMKMRELPFNKVVREGERPKPAEEAEEELAAEAGARQAGAEEGEEEEDMALIFFFAPDDEEHGSLSPETMVEFVFNETKYTSLYQAYEVERVTMLGRKDARPLLLRTRSPKQLRARAALIRGEVEDARGLWTEILTAAVKQDARFAPVLRATGKDELVFADPRDEKLGIGLPAEDPRAMDKTQWKGQNLLGQAWMAVREALPAGPDADAEERIGEMKGGGYTEHGVTKQEQGEMRSRVLMGRYRRPGGGV